MQRALLLLLIAASYLLLAGGPTWTLAPLVGLAAVTALAAPARTFAFPADQRQIDLALLAVLGGIILQLVPLPFAGVAALSPHAAELRASLQFTTFQDQAPAWTTVSVNPRATMTALATVALGILTFWAARGLFSAGGSSRTVCRALAFLGGLAAVTALVQRAVTPRALLFVLEPEARSANPFGAFVNRNHFAAWMILVAAPVCGYCIARLRIHEPQRGRRWRPSIGQIMSSGTLYTALAVFMQIGAILVTLSRSALAGLGVAAITGWRLGYPRIQLERTSLPAMLAVGGGALMLMVLFVDVDGWAARLTQSLEAAPQFSRTTIWRESAPIVRDFWLTGTGAGTYGDAMTKYQQTRMWVGSMQRWAHFNNAHSHYVQIAAEGGMLLLIPALWACVAAARLGRRAINADKGEMFWVRVGAAAGLAGLATQSIWEVALIMPANAVMAGVAGGLMLYRRDPQRQDSLPPTPDAPPPRPTPARLR